MIMHDFNMENGQTILLIHPMLSSANGMKTVVADYLGSSFHYLIPDLSAHGEAVKQEYKSASEEAKEIHDYLQEKGNTRIQLAFGASLGGVVLCELLKYADIVFEHIFFEGTSFYKHAPIREFCIRMVFLKKHQKAVANPELSVRKMKEIYGERAARPMAEQFIAMSEDSIRNIVYDCANVALPELGKELQERCVFAYGEKDADYAEAKKIQPKMYPYAEMKVWTGYEHCTKMTENPEAYANLLRNYLTVE